VYVDDVHVCNDGTCPSSSAFNEESCVTLATHTVDAKCADAKCVRADRCAVGASAVDAGGIASEFLFSSPPQFSINHARLSSQMCVLSTSVAVVTSRLCAMAAARASKTRARRLRCSRRRRRHPTPARASSPPNRVRATLARAASKV
jgi:hypothetical protein